MLKRAIFLSLLSCAVAGTAFAHPDAGELDVGVWAGWHVFDKSNALGAEDGETAGTIDDAPVFGLRAGYNVLSRLALELEAGVMFASPRNDTGDNAFGFLYRANALLRLTPDHLGGHIFLNV